MGVPEDKYLTSEYLDANPSWDLEDSPWKARKVVELLARHSIVPRVLGDIGCGAGGILAELRASYPEARLRGIDIAPAVARFWESHAEKKIEFQTGDFFSFTHPFYDVLLVLDVLEHLADPFAFLHRVRPYSEHFVFHFPLDLSAFSVLRENPLLTVRRKMGHIHYFTKGLALALLQESGFAVKECCYSGAFRNGPRHSLKTWLVLLPRILVYALNKDAGVHLLGGETIFVLARRV